MAIKKFKPTSPALREMTVFISDEVTTNQPEKSLLVPLKKNSGRNVHGKITVRHRGGGNRRKYRIIDFVLSNCSNSGIDTVGVLTQYKPQILNSHIGMGDHWDLDRVNGGVTILQPYMNEKEYQYRQ